MFKFLTELETVKAKPGSQHGCRASNKKEFIMVNKYYRHDLDDWLVGYPDDDDIVKAVHQDNVLSRVFFYTYEEEDEDGEEQDIFIGMFHTKEEALAALNAKKEQERMEQEMRHCCCCFKKYHKSSKNIVTTNRGSFCRLCALELTYLFREHGFVK